MPMKLEPLKQWKCDTCGETINSPDDGYVEWKTDEEGRSMDFRLIHQSRTDGTDPHRCSFPLEYGSSMPVTSLIGHDGLAYRLKDIEREFDRGSTGGIRELTELTRRLHIPLHEEARLYFDEAERSGSNVEDRSLTQLDLREIIEEHGNPSD